MFICSQTISWPLGSFEKVYSIQNLSKGKQESQIKKFALNATVYVQFWKHCNRFLSQNGGKVGILYVGYTINEPKITKSLTASKCVIYYCSLHLHNRKQSGCEQRLSFILSLNRKRRESVSHRVVLSIHSKKIPNSHISITYINTSDHTTDTNTKRRKMPNARKDMISGTL